jgi:hypothetical protein
MNIREKICLYGDKYEDDINREKKNQTMDALMS